MAASWSKGGGGLERPTRAVCRHTDPSKYEAGKNVQAVPQLREKAASLRSVDSALEIDGSFFEPIRSAHINGKTAKIILIN